MRKISQYLSKIDMPTVVKLAVFCTGVQTKFAKFPRFQYAQPGTRKYPTTCCHTIPTGYHKAVTCLTPTNMIRLAPTLHRAYSIARPLPTAKDS